MNKLKLVLLITIMTLASTVTLAHFQLIFTPKTYLGQNDSGQIDLSLIFTHPGGGTHDSIPEPLSMDMAEPVKFGVWNKGKFTNLTDELKQFSFKHGQREAIGYEINYRLRGMGDFMFTLEPGPYWEKSEGIYITQYAKVIVNRIGLPTDWDKYTGMKAEIVPLNWPINLYEGSTFRGIVMKDGKPVPHAQIEVEYLNAKSFKGAFGSEMVEYDFEGGESPAMLLKANEDGEFSFTYPWPGWWGFAALMEGEPYNGEDQEIGAAIMMKIDEDPFKQ